MPYFEDDNLWTVAQSEKKGTEAERGRWCSLPPGAAIPGITSRGDRRKRFHHGLRSEGPKWYLISSRNRIRPLCMCGCMRNV